MRQSSLPRAEIGRAAAVAAVLFLLTGFSACRSDRSDQAVASAGALVGVTQDQLRACAGRPARRRANGAEWIYVDGDPTASIPRFCEAKVRFVDGAVSSIRYSTTGALYGRKAECAGIFARC